MFDAQIKGNNSDSNHDEHDSKDRIIAKSKRAKAPQSDKDLKVTRFVSIPGWEMQLFGMAAELVKCS